MPTGISSLRLVGPPYIWSLKLIIRQSEAFLHALAEVVYRKAHSHSTWQVEPTWEH